MFRRQIQQCKRKSARHNKCKWLANLIFPSFFTFFFLSAVTDRNKLPLRSVLFVNGSENCCYFPFWWLSTHLKPLLNLLLLLRLINRTENAENEEEMFIHRRRDVCFHAPKRKVGMVIIFVFCRSLAFAFQSNTKKSEFWWLKSFLCKVTHHFYFPNTREKVYFFGAMSRATNIFCMRGSRDRIASGQAMNFVGSRNIYRLSMANEHYKVPFFFPFSTLWRLLLKDCDHLRNEWTI